MSVPGAAYCARRQIGECTWAVMKRRSPWYPRTPRSVRRSVVGHGRSIRLGQYREKRYKFISTRRIVVEDSRGVGLGQYCSEERAGA
eukprot:86170-Rhodomonas_salina.1